jgi:ribonuclease HI
MHPVFFGKTGVTSDHKASEDKWKTIWSVRVPSKSSIFLWRLARHSLLSGDVLQHRKMAQSSACFSCGQQDSWRHSLLECNITRCVWDLVDEHTVEAVCEIEDMDAKSWLVAIFKVLPHVEAVRVSVVLWAIGFVHRKGIHENIFQSPLSTHGFIERFMAGLGEGQVKPFCSHQVVQQRERWIPLPEGAVKINVDAALSKNDQIASATAIVRDEIGRFMGASMLVLKGVSEPEVMEVIACREGLSLALDIQAHKVKLVCDNQSVVNNIHQGGRGVYGQVIQEIKARSTDLGQVIFVHDYRTSNIDAHRIARSSLYNGEGRHVWFLSPPFGVCNSYANSDE